MSKRSNGRTAVLSIIAAALAAGMYYGIFRLVFFVIKPVPQMYVYLPLLFLITGAAAFGLSRLRLPWLAILPGGGLLSFAAYWLYEEFVLGLNFMSYFMLPYVVLPVVIFSAAAAVAVLIVRAVRRSEKEDRI